MSLKIELSRNASGFTPSKTCAVRTVRDLTTTTAKGYSLGQTLALAAVVFVVVLAAAVGGMALGLF